MIKRIFKISVLIASVAILFSSCSKDDDDSGSSTNGKTTAVFNSSVTYGTMTDQDGNVYKTVTIGTQTWMAENLRTTTYNDGTSISNVTGATEWGNLTTGAYCNYINTASTDTIATYGRLYNWYAANTGKLAPAGWHVPTDAEWTTLIEYLGGEDVAGGKLKETGTTHWDSPNTGATNETGFTALPGGLRIYDGGFSDFGYTGYWWSATENYANYARYRRIVFNSNDVYISSSSMEMGYSVRCVMD
jgi:uncharacterized protein (TIGR02145 family)